MEQLLQLTAADEIVPADLFQGEWTVQVLFHVGGHPLEALIASRCGERGCGLFPAADETDEQLFQCGAYQLLPAEGRNLPALETLGGGIVQRSGKCRGALLHDTGQQSTFRFSRCGDESLEKVHIRTVATEADYH